MVIKMPPMVGMQTHPNLMTKVDKAVAKADWPLELDCSGVSFTTSMFVRFIVQINKKVRKAGGQLKLTSVDGIIFEGLDKTGLISTIEVTRAVKKGRIKHD